MSAAESVAHIASSRRTACSTWVSSRRSARSWRRHARPPAFGQVWHGMTCGLSSASGSSVCASGCEGLRVTRATEGALEKHRGIRSWKFLQVVDRGIARERPALCGEDCPALRFEMGAQSSVVEERCHGPALDIGFLARTSVAPSFIQLRARSARFGGKFRPTAPAAHLQSMLASQSRALCSSPGNGVRCKVCLLRRSVLVPSRPFGDGTCSSCSCQSDNCFVSE